VPLPRLVLPTAGPLFRRSEATIQERLFPLQQTFAIERTQQRSPGVEPHILLFALLQPPPAGRRRGILIGQETPRSTRLQHPQDALEASPVRRPRTAAFFLAMFRFRQQRRNQLPLSLTQQFKPLLAHARSSSNRPPLPEIHSLRPNLFMKRSRQTRFELKQQEDILPVYIVKRIARPPTDDHALLRWAQANVQRPALNCLKTAFR
jgi:hypothetical protein